MFTRINLANENIDVRKLGHVSEGLIARLLHNELACQAVV
jgi:hypothetical protein